MRRRSGRGNAIVGGTLALLACGCATSGEQTVDPSHSTERVYVVNTYNQSLSVIDHATRTVDTTIALDGRPHGQVPSADGRRLYVTTSGGHGEVLALDTATDEILWRLDVGTSLHQPALTSDDRWLFAPDFARGVVALVDVGAARLEQTIPLRDGDAVLAGAHNAYAGAGGRYVYQTAIYSGAVARLDIASRTVDRIYRVAGHPRPMALLADESKAYVQLSQLHGLIELDLESGLETRRVEWPLPDGVATGDTLCHGLGIPPDATEIWAASSVARDIRVLSLPNLVELFRIPLDATPQWIAFSRDGQTAYVTLAAPSRAEGTVAVIDRGTRRVAARLPVGREPKRVHTVVVPPAS